MAFDFLQESCLTVKRYIDGPLGHYVINVTAAAKLCSKVLCKKNGRCIRKNSESSAYLHLSSNSFKIRVHYSEKGPRFVVTGKPGPEDIEAMKQRFMCQCYQGWTGIFCELPNQKLLGHLAQVANFFLLGAMQIFLLFIAL